MKRLALVTLAVALCVTSAVPLRAATTEPARHNATTIPHVLRIADIGEFTTLNPMFTQQLTESRLASLTMAWLVKYDRSNRPIPELATVVPTQQNGGISADGKTITYHLRKGVKWSDGQPFDADDVVFTTNLINNPKTNVLNKDGWKDIVKIEAPDKYTVVFHMRQPYSPFLATFFGSAGANPAIVPKHVLENSANANTDSYNSKPIGIGPFRYVEWRRGDRIIMEANPFYFRGLPKLKRVEYRIIPSRDTVVNSLQTGEIDMWMVGAAAYWNRLRAIKSITAVKQPSYAFSHLDFNLDRPIFKDVRVRKALSIAIDRQTLINKISNGVGRVQDGIISPASPFYDPSIPRTPWDISRANALLDQAGWKMGQDGVRVKDGQRLAVTFVSNSGSPDTDARLELIRGWWRQIGVQLDRKEYPPSLMFAQVSEGGIINTGKFDAILFAWYLSPTGDLSSIYGCAEFTPSGQNSLHWCNKKADEAMTGEKLTYDFAKQKKLDDIVQQAIVADVPTYVLNIAEDIFAYNSDLKGFHPNAVSAYDDFMNVDI